MSTAIINSVQTLKRYKKVGYTQEQAEEQVEILQEAAEEIFRKIKEDAENTKALTEGKFLYEIEKLRSETIKWVVGTGITSVLVLTGIMFSLLKLFIK